MDDSDMVQLLTLAYNEGLNKIEPHVWRLAMDVIRDGNPYSAPTIVGDDDSLYDMVTKAINVLKRVKKLK